MALQSRALTVIAEQFFPIDFQHVKGHSGNAYNEYADFLAKGFATGDVMPVAPPPVFPDSFHDDKLVRDWTWL